MFKAGDKVKLNRAGELQRFGCVKPDTVYIVDEYKYPNVAIKDVGISYWKGYFELVESASEPKKEEVKILKVEVKETTKEVVQKFPCIRKGKTTGKLYLFHSEKYGYCLENQTSSSWEHTEPFTGTVTLTQE